MRRKHIQELKEAAKGVITSLFSAACCPVSHILAQVYAGEKERRRGSVDPVFRGDAMKLEDNPNVANLMSSHGMHHCDHKVECGLTWAGILQATTR